MSARNILADIIRASIIGAALWALSGLAFVVLTQVWGMA